MALATKPVTRCPFCKETILEGAVKCKHCHSELSAPPAARPKRLARLNTFRIGFLVGVVFTLILVILV
ncbi:MAG TPA: hypothetical protein PLR32_02700, partial [candidate division Zixibacteria bacterium]|nr:hypothetical protein [candidate division Zixibacteria bacterium]